MLSSLIMTPNQKINKLAKFLAYVLGRRPDEFGLLPDGRGYVKIKDLLKALSEEEGWRHIRRAAIDELCITLDAPPVEFSENLIRAVDRDHMPVQQPAGDLPKLLYVCIRQRAHHHTLQRGVFPAGSQRIILTPDPEMAVRMGKRIDGDPVQVTVQAHAAAEQGVAFDRMGDLYLADYIPVGCFTAPPLPKEKADPKPKEAPVREPADPMPGSFFMDVNRGGRPKAPHEKTRKNAKQPWKKDRKQQRKHKEKMWPS